MIKTIELTNGLQFTVPLLDILNSKRDKNGYVKVWLLTTKGERLGRMINGKLRPFKAKIL